MLFNLNSIDERNPANFKNRFSDNVVIEKDSYIRLIGATITRKNYVKKIIFASAGICRIRLNCYDVFDINIPAGTYTLLEFCNLINALFTHYDSATDIGAVCAITSLHVFIGGTPDEEILEFRIKWKGDTNDNGFSTRTLMGIDERYGRYLARDLDGKTSANLKPNAINGINSVIGGNAGIYTSMGGVIEGTSPFNPNGYTIPPLQVNGSSLNIGTMPQNFLGNTFIIGQPDLPNIKFLLGRAEYDTATNKYTSGAFFGSPQWANPSTTNNCPLYMNFKNTGQYDYHLYNTTTGAFQQFGTDINYHPADIFRFNFVRPDRTPLDQKQAGCLNLHHITSNSMVFFYQMNLSQAYHVWNVLTPQALDLQEYIVSRGSGAYDFNNYSNYWTTNSATTYNRPIGCRAGTGSTAEGNYADCNENNGFPFADFSGADQNITLQTGNPNTWLNGTPFFERYSAGAAPSVTPDRRCHLKISSSTAGGIKISGKPMMISFYFRLVDDTAKLPGGNIDSHCFINDAATGQRMINVRPLQGVAHDVELYLGGVSKLLVLQNASATRINIQYGKDYFMRVSYNGTTHDTYTASIYDIDANDTFNATTAGAGDYFNAIGSLGHDEAPASNYILSFNGYMGEFRTHLSSQNTTITPTYWDSTYTDLCSYMRTGTRTMKYYWNYDLKQTFPIPAQYTNIGLINNRATLTPVFDKDTMTIGYDQNWGDFVAPAFSHATYMNNNTRKTDLGVDAYDGDELGLLNVALLDPDGADDIVFPYIDVRGNVVVEPEQVGDNEEIISPDNVLYPISAEINDIELEDKTINIQIPNLPHKSYNGVNGSQDKTIGQVPITGLNANRLERNNLDVITAYTPTANYIALNNAGEIPLNELHVRLCDIKGVEIPAVEIAQETNIQLEIKSRNEIF
jgi:hypothetical protein